MNDQTRRPLGVAITGAAGRMGQALAEALADQDRLRAVAAFESDQSPHRGRPFCDVAITGLHDEPKPEIDVFIDFSVPRACLRYAEEAAQRGAAFVSGTTGLSEAEDQALDGIARRIPLLWAPNMSPGANLLFGLVELAAKALGDDFDPEIIEIHHRYKQDAPSGTALRLADAVGSGRALRAVHGRSGRPGPRQSDELGIHALRCGGVVGDHTVIFGGNAERLELTHRAAGRATFASGALRAASFIAGRPPGRYTMAQVLGLSATND